MCMTTILAITPSTDDAARLAALLRSLGLESYSYSEASHAIHHILTHPENLPDLIILHAHHDDSALLATVESLHRLARKSRILLLVSLAQRPLALDALKRGAHDFLCTPFQDQQLQTTLQRLLESYEVKNPTLSPALITGFESMVGNSAAILQLQLRGRAYSQSRQHLLLRGERGVGKTHLAFALLQAEGSLDSALRSFPFKDLRYIIRLIDQQDAGGTLIVDLPERVAGGTPLQGDLQRACEHATQQGIRMFFCQRTGRRGRKPALPESAESQMALLTYAPLRTRPEDIAAQFGVFNRRTATMLNRPLLRLKEEGMAMLLGHDWPGNTRELQYLVFQLYMTQETGLVEPSLLDSFLQRPAMPGPYLAPPLASPTENHASIKLLNEKGELREWDAIESDYLREAFQFYRGHKSEIARKTGMGRSTLYRKVKSLNLS